MLLQSVHTVRAAKPRNRMPNTAPCTATGVPTVRRYGRVPKPYGRIPHSIKVRTSQTSDNTPLCNVHSHCNAHAAVQLRAGNRLAVHATVPPRPITTCITGHQEPAVPHSFKRMSARDGDQTREPLYQNLSASTGVTNGRRSAEQARA